MGEAALDELNCSFEGCPGCDEQMKVIGHQDEFVEEIGFALIREQRFEEQSSPGLGAKECAALPGFGRDEVGLSVVGGVLACGFQNLPSGAEAPFTPILCGTAKAVPFQNVPLTWEGNHLSDCQSRALWA